MIGKSVLSIVVSIVVGGGILYEKIQAENLYFVDIS